MKQQFFFWFFLGFIFIGILIFNPSGVKHVSSSKKTTSNVTVSSVQEAQVLSVISRSTDYVWGRGAFLKDLEPLAIDSVAFSAWCDSFLEDNHGLIRTRNLYRFFDLINDLDTSAHLWDFVQSENKYTGKYFRFGKRVIACFENYGLFEYHHIYLLEKKEGNWKILNDSAFYHGNYPCCWESKTSGFGYDRGYFYIDVCGTGSSFCSQYRNMIEVSGDSLFISPIRMGFYDGNYDKFISHSKINVLSKQELIITHNQKVFPYDEIKGLSKHPLKRTLKLRYKKNNNHFILSDTVYQAKSKGFFWSDWWF